MSLAAIVAYFTCDKCGKPAACDIDPIANHGVDGNVHSIAESELKENHDFVVEDGLHICSECSSDSDLIHSRKIDRDFLMGT